MTMPRFRAAMAGLLCSATWPAAAGSAAAAPSPAFVVFLDTGNTGRSLIAEKYAERYLAKRGWQAIEVASRGTAVDPDRRSPEAGAVAVLFPQGIDPTGHLAEQLTAADVARATVVLAVAEKNKEQACSMFPDACEKVFLISSYVGAGASDVVDAFGEPFPAYQRVSQQLATFVPKALVRVAAASA